MPASACVDTPLLPIGSLVSCHWEDLLNATSQWLFVLKPRGSGLAESVGLRPSMSESGRELPTGLRCCWLERDWLEGAGLMAFWNWLCLGC